MSNPIRRDVENQALVVIKNNVFVKKGIAPLQVVNVILRRVCGFVLVIVWAVVYPAIKKEIH